MHSFPNAASIEAFHAWRADASRWLPIAMDIARSHSLSCADAQVFSMGTNLVVALDQRLILKIYPPMLRHQFESERAALARLHGRLSISVPRIVFEGERSGWPYLVMTRMNGVNGKEAWVSLPEDQRESVLGKVGEIIAEVQRVPVGDLSRLQPQRLGLPQKYLDGLEHFLRDAPAVIPVHAAPVILTGEYNLENIFLEERSGRWRLAAVIDFGDVMTGWGEYDLLGPSTFAAAGVPGRVRSLLRGFGYANASAYPELRRRLMTLLLLHRFSNLAVQICIEDWQQKAADLDELEGLLWPV
jgi:hygromycin-B 7''-O-kinase